MKYSFIRFLFVGILNTIVGITTIYILLHVFGLGFWPATLIGNTIGACVSYLLNMSFTFQSNKPVSKTWYRFIIVIGICYFVSYFMGKNTVVLFAKSVSFPSIITLNDSAIIIGTIFYIVLNYFGQRLFVFQMDKQNPG